MRGGNNPGSSLAEEGDASTLERSLTVVKVAKPKQDMRFDVPVSAWAPSLAMQQAGATCLAIEAGRTLIFDLEAVTAAADPAGIAIVADSIAYPVKTE